jgi:hypothetical protein
MHGRSDMRELELRERHLRGRHVSGRSLLSGRGLRELELLERRHLRSVGSGGCRGGMHGGWRLREFELLE